MDKRSAVRPVSRRGFLVWSGAIASARLCPTFATEPNRTAPQPYFASVRRALEALDKAGAPVATADAQQIAVLSRQNSLAAVSAAEEILDRYTLVRIQTDADGYAHVAVGGAPRTLVEQGWRLFLIRISNPLGTTAKLDVAASGGWPPDTLNFAPIIEKAWWRGEFYEAPPMESNLTGMPLEYKVIQFYSRDRGQHEAEFVFFVPIDAYRWYGAWPGLTGRITRLTFDCLPSRDIKLRIRDVDGRGCMAGLTIKDPAGRVYPLQGMRLAPDMQFQAQIYRADGETVRLPDGQYTIESRRGPEYLGTVQTVVVAENLGEIAVQLQRWIDRRRFTGDHDSARTR